MASASADAGGGSEHEVDDVPAGGDGSQGESDGQDQNSDSEEEGSESSSPPTPTLNLKERAVRSTAGHRAQLTSSKELEDDEAFWGHADFQDSSDDSEFEPEPEKESEESESSDSDFSKDEEDEPKQGSKEEKDKKDEVDDESAARKRAKDKMRFSPFMRSAATLAKSKAKAKARKPRVHRIVPISNRTMRGSTVEKREEIKQLAEAAAAKLQAEVSRPARAVKAKLTQKDRLEIAVHTEEMNLKELRAHLSYEEEARRRARRTLKRQYYDGPRARMVSRLAGSGQDVANSSGDLIGSRVGVESFVAFFGCDFEGALERAGCRLKKKKY
eukprot:TRINITY_DN12732_c0_g1_i1.p1 TRINITY_DN12732_c0_g1~~TRINITY_DN12732_c0_g1_i1.p1  ORF type:complete len:329 (+),score=102.51 TRINITY_DN12732_c0_g1_i1:101-1087(+)